MPAIFATLHLNFSGRQNTAILRYESKSALSLLACESVPVSAYVHERVYMCERGSAVTFERTKVHACSYMSVRE